MKIVLSGVETHNKGAELMLYAILQEIERKFPTATVYLPVDGVRQGKAYVKTSLNLKYKPIDKWFRLAQRTRWNGLMYRFGLLGGMMMDVFAIKKADYFLDGSGLLFSDQQRLTDIGHYKWEHLLKRQKAEGTKIVFLPQAFGPIEKSETKQVVAVLGKYADVIMPREQVSYNYMANCGLIDEKKLRRFTDFTSLVHADCPETYKHLAGQVCLIPNKRMVDQGVIGWDAYLHLLQRIAEAVQAQQKKLYLLNHEGVGDEKIARRISNSLPYPVEVVTGLNALDTKGVISTAYAVISSRFHGVASALNSCVPCLATSWSHKYAALFNDYGLNDCILPINDENLCIQMIESILSPDMNTRIREQLASTLLKIEKETLKMWDVVWEDTHNFSK